MSGTYRQYASGASYWFREFNDCDLRSGYLVFSEGVFNLYSGYSGFIIAQCELENNSTWDTLELFPNNCTDWKTIESGSLDYNKRLPDATFEITDGACTGETYECIETEAPQTLCLTKNSVVHGFLEGEYNKTGVVGKNYGTPEYKKIVPLNDGGDLQDVYIFWFGELDNATDFNFKWWVISSNSLSSAQTNQSAFVYGICESDVANPLDCKSGWSFYFGGYFLDDEFEMTEGECMTTTTNEPREWPEYLCVGLVNETKGVDSSYIPEAYFVGGYVLNSTGTRLSNGFPHWVKPYNDVWNYDIYLYYDGVYGWWQIGSGIHVDQYVNMICHQEDGYSPIDCTEWYDGYSTEQSNMIIYECTADDVSQVNPICLTENSVMSDYLEGDYLYTGVYGDIWTTREYAPSEPKMYDGELVNVYMWFYGETDYYFDYTAADYKWIITNYSYTEGKYLDNVPIYGYCEDTLGYYYYGYGTYGPEYCSSCWQFEYKGKYYEDCEFTVTTDSDLCIEDTDGDIEWNDYVCIEIDNSLTDDVVIPNFNLDTIIGGYILNDTNKRLSGDKPLYYKPANDYTKKPQYMWYDEFYNYWSIGPEVYVNATMQCQEDGKDYAPSQCEVWFDSSSTILYNVHIYTRGCTEDDVLQAITNDDSGLSGGMIALIVILCILLIVAIIAVWIYCQRKRQEDIEPYGVPQDVGKSIEMNDTQHMRMESVSGGGGTGMDMAPLNATSGKPEGNETLIDDDSVVPRDDDDDNDDEALLET